MPIKKPKRIKIAKIKIGNDIIRLPYDADGEKGVKQSLKDYFKSLRKKAKGGKVYTNTTRKPKT
tara:strand:+ start:879 stop:1070 length:192 start_codon:yes stop_codon:yes gene_type:complete